MDLDFVGAFELEYGRMVDFSRITVVLPGNGQFHNLGLNCLIPPFPVPLLASPLMRYATHASTPAHAAPQIMTLVKFWSILIFNFLMFPVPKKYI